MLEAELFGFEVGAFTDAKRAKPGLFEATSEGTLFLDEIDALPLLLQGKLLTALESKEVRRLGAVTARAVDVKLIAATNGVLPEAVAAGRLRADLYHRLAVVVLALPPLREREADIFVLAQAYLQQSAAAHGVPPKHLSAAAEAWLQGYAWPGTGGESDRAARDGKIAAARRVSPAPQRPAYQLCRRTLLGVRERHPLSAGPGAATGPLRHSRGR
jgi:transcriptional regulator with PAS, ATPase and Fis domain